MKEKRSRNPRVTEILTLEALVLCIPSHVNILSSYKVRRRDRRPNGHDSVLRDLELDHLVLERHPMLQEEPSSRGGYGLLLPMACSDLETHRRTRWFRALS